MHLELETHWEVVSQNPFHDFARIDPAEDGREEDGAAALVESMLEIFATPGAGREVSLPGNAVAYSEGGYLIFTRERQDRRAP